MDEVKAIYECDNKGVAVGKLEHSSSESEGGSSSLEGSNTTKVAENKVVVGFEKDVNALMAKLQDSGRNSGLEIISIIGEAGSGKTTLAREVFDHPLMSSTFEIRAWINVSPDYDETMMRNLLIQIWESASPEKYRDYKKSSVDKNLEEDTHKFLKNKKFLIFMDDMWGIEAWNDIQKSLPRKSNGSKVLFTTRQRVEPKNIPDRDYIPHKLDPLPTSCGRELLRKKVFGKKCWPAELVGISYDIIEKCEGQPLMIDTIADILVKEDKTLEAWEEFCKQFPEIIEKIQYKLMEKLEISYNHLPLHLKECLVYIGGFPEGTEIFVRELIWLWIAEGFIQQSEEDKSLEDVARDYLSSLIDRGLVTVTRKRSAGGIKVCRIHDLVRKLCLKKAKKDNFLVQIFETDKFLPSAEHCRLFIIGSQYKAFEKLSSSPCTRNFGSFLCLNLQNSNSSGWGTTNLSVVKNFELLGVLRFASDTSCEGKIRNLLHLRYLAVQLPEDSSKHVSPFSSLFNLETLNLQPQSSFDWNTNIPLPHDIFKMVKLRHLYTKRGVFKYGCLYPDEEPGFGFDQSSKLYSLQTLSSICPCEKCQTLLEWTPSLRKLGFYGELICNIDFVLMLPNLEFLTCLETLSLNNSVLPFGVMSTLPPVLKFPPTITQLTLKKTGLEWKELSILQTLPMLEILKLLDEACLGSIWSTIDLEVEFSQLKYLRLQNLNIKEWNASKDQFPTLEVLVVNHCIHLKEIPSQFADLNELRKMEVRKCNRSLELSAKEIQKRRKDTLGEDDYLDLQTEGNDR